MAFGFVKKLGKAAGHFVAGVPRATIDVAKGDFKAAGKHALWAVNPFDVHLKLGGGSKPSAPPPSSTPSAADVAAVQAAADIALQKAQSVSQPSQPSQSTASGYIPPPAAYGGYGGGSSAGDFDRYSSGQTFDPSGQPLPPSSRGIFSQFSEASLPAKAAIVGGIGLVAYFGYKAIKGGRSAGGSKS